MSTRLSPPVCWFANNLRAHTRFSHATSGAACARNTFATLFVAEGTGNISSCEENSHSQWKPCANPDKAQSPSDQRKTVIIENTGFRSLTFTQRRPSVIPMEGPRCNTLKPNSKKAQTLPRHEPHVRDLMERAHLFRCVHNARAALLWICHMWICHSSKAFLSSWTGCDNKGKGGGERKKSRKKERERQADSLKEDLRVSYSKAPCVSL